MKKNQQGFTLIELIIVIVILGILAATASPKFLDFTSEAKVSTVQGLSASLKSGANIVYSKALVQGKGSAATSTTTGPTIDIAYGYPQATETAIKAVLDINIGDSSASPAVVGDWEVTANSSATPKSIRIFPYGSTAANCFVEYTEASGVNAGATVTTTTSAC